MKKILTIFALLFVLVLAACSNETGEGNSNKDNSKEDDSNKGENSAFVQGVTDTEILVGVTGPQSGPAAEFDKTRKGMEAYFDVVNENGGVKGRKIKMIAYDDQYQPAKTVQSMQRLIEEDKVFSLIFPLGTANVGASFDMIKESGIPITGLGTGATKFVDPAVKNVFGMMFNNAIEAKIMVDFAVNDLGAKKIAVAYQNDDFGLDSLAGAKDAITAYSDVEIVKEVNFLASDKDFSSQAQQLVQADADAYLILSTMVPAASIRGELYKLKAADTPYIVTSTGGGDKNVFNLAGAEVWEGVYSNSTYPTSEEEQSGDEQFQAYLTGMRDKVDENSIGGLSRLGWGVAQVFVEAVNRIEGDITWESYIAALESFDNFTDSIFSEITFTDINRYGNTTTRMIQAKDGEYVPLDLYYYDVANKKVIKE